MPGISKGCASALTLVVTVRNVYGRPTIYPVNDTARLIAYLAGTETLTPRAVKAALQAGASVQVHNDNGSLLDRLLTGAA